MLAYRQNLALAITPITVTPINLWLILRFSSPRWLHHRNRRSICLPRRNPPPLVKAPA